MESLQHRTELAALVSSWRASGDRIAVVPTMGNLHDGHLSLVRKAQANADRVIVTLFVNPTQFGDGEDFEIYPRSLDQDVELLQQAGADVLFAPDVKTVYPFGIENATSVSVPGLTSEFCGSSRPGHFDGVTTVVTRLLSLAQPDVAVFGQKDYQQLLVIQRLVEDLGLPVEVLAGPIVRESDGLAMSSRNSNLGEQDREIAPLLYQGLLATATQLQAGGRNLDDLEQEAKNQYESTHISPEYFAIRQASDLQLPDENCEKFVILVAANFADVRLIDNIVVSI